MKSSIILLAIAAMPLTAGIAAAQCAVIDPVAVPNIRINPLDAAGATQLFQPLTLRFQRTGMDTRPFQVVYQIVDEDSPVQMRVGMTAGPQIEWRTNDAARDVGVTRTDGFTVLRSGIVGFPAGATTQSVDLRLFLKNLREDLPAGVYREQYTLRYWCEDPNASGASELPGVLSVAVEVPNVLSAAVVGGSSRGEIDFQDFSTLTRSLSVLVRSTGRYTVSARSINNLALVREGSNVASTSDRIQYDMRFDGQSIGQSDASSIMSPRAGLEGRQISLDIVAEDVSKKRAGRYADTVILTLSPTN